MRASPEMLTEPTHLAALERYSKGLGDVDGYDCEHK